MAIASALVKRAGKFCPHFEPARFPVAFLNCTVIKLASLIFLFLVSFAVAGEVLEDRIEKTIPLQADGAFSLRAIDGSVEIYGAEKNEVKLVAIRKAFSLERLNQIQIQISGRDDAVKIETTAPPQTRWGLKDRSGTVDYLINLPQHARILLLDVPNGDVVIHGMRGGPVDASLGNGRMTAHNCYCNQTLRVQRGRLDLFFDWNDLRAIAVDARVINGNIQAVIPGDSSFRLRAASATGRVASDFTQMNERKRGGVSQIDEVIGNVPRSQLVLQTTNGNIRISQSSW